MLIAEELPSHRLVVAAQADRERQYVCQTCRTQVTLRQGVHRQYFAHQRGLGAHQAERPIHQQGKAALAAYAQAQGYQVAQEVWLPECQQRPDLLVHNPALAQPLAVEYQCAPIAVEQVQQRHQGYLKAGYQPRWFVGPAYLKRPTIWLRHFGRLAQIKQQWWVVGEGWAPPPVNYQSLRRPLFPLAWTATDPHWVQHQYHRGLRRHVAWLQQAQNTLYEAGWDLLRMPAAWYPGPDPWLSQRGALQLRLALTQQIWAGNVQVEALATRADCWPQWGCVPAPAYQRAWVKQLIAAWQAEGLFEQLAPKKIHEKTPPV